MITAEYLRTTYPPKLPDAELNDVLSQCEYAAKQGLVDADCVVTVDSRSYEWDRRAIAQELVRRGFTVGAITYTYDLRDRVHHLLFPVSWSAK